jgi:acetyl esterase
MTTMKNAPGLDPEIAAFLNLQRAAKIPDLATVPLGEARAVTRALRLPWNRGGPVMARSVEGAAGGMRYRLHWPARQEAGRSPFTLYLHGGGWTILDIDTHDRVTRALAAASGFPVLAADYPLSPEARFPAALDALETLVEAIATTPGAGLDASRMAVAGDSAGANLAVALALRLRDKGGALPQGLGLYYGIYDGDLDVPSYRAYGDGSLPLSRGRMKWFWENYVPDEAGRRAPLAAPLHADVRGLPPSFLAVADHDVLFDENLAFAEHLKEAGNEVELRVYPGTIHGFIEAAGAVGAKVAEQALADVGAFLRARLSAT